MKRGLLFATAVHVQRCTEALTHAGCTDIAAVSGLEDLDDVGYDLAIVEVFDAEKALVRHEDDPSKRHRLTDESPSVLLLRALCERFPQCVTLAISHKSCENGSEYVESNVLASRCVAVDWTQLDPGFLIVTSLSGAIEDHPKILDIRYMHVARS